MHDRIYIKEDGVPPQHKTRQLAGVRGEILTSVGPGDTSLDCNAC